MCCGKNMGASNQQLKLILSLVFKFAYDLRKRTNVTGLGEAKPFQCGDQIKASKLDIEKQVKYQSSQSENANILNFF